MAFMGRFGGNMDFTMHLPYYMTIVDADTPTFANGQKLVRPSPKLGNYDATAFPFSTIHLSKGVGRQASFFIEVLIF